MHVEEHEPPFDVAELVELLRAPGVQGDLVRVAADLAEGVPFGVIRVPVALALREKNVGLAERLLGVRG